MCRNLGMIGLLAFVGVFVLAPMQSAIAASPQRPGDDPTDLAEVRKNFKAAQKDLVQKVRSGIEADRIEAMIALREFPLQDAARMSMNVLDDANAEVRKEAHETIVSFHKHAHVCKLYLGQLRTESRRQGWNAVSYSLLFALAMSPDEEMQAEFINMVDMHATARPNNLLILNEVIEGLGARGDDDALAGLRTFGNSRLIAADFGFRRGLIQAIIAIRTSAAVDLLVELLPHINGEVQGDAIKYLTAISGERFGDNADHWSLWWERNRDGFEFPNALESPADVMAAFAAEGTATYYDLPIFAQRMVFIIDCSGSMNRRGRMAAAKRELIDAINALSDEKYFNIVAYNSRVGPWQPDLQQATTLAKATAARWIESLRAEELTASYDALEATFGFKNLEAIYFVSDGAPTTGKIVDKEKIVEAVREGNRIRRVTLYTIGIEPDEDPENSFEGFLKALAQENYGLYRPVGDFSKK